MRVYLTGLAVLMWCAAAAAEPPTPADFAAHVRSGELAPSEFDFAATGLWSGDAEERARWRAAASAELVRQEALNGSCAAEDIRGLAALPWIGLVEDAADADAWDAAAAALRSEIEALNGLAEARAAGRRDQAARRSSAGRYMDALGDARDTRSREALQRVIRDQTFRMAYISAAPRLPPAAEAQWRRLVGSQLAAVDCDNAAWLERQLAEIPWFGIPEFGRRVDNAAWLIAQHADRRPDLQRLVLQRLEALPSGATTPRNVAFLWDRIAVAENRPQRYGTQIHCRDGVLQALNGVEDEAQIDARRAEMGLSRWSQYWEEMRGSLPCSGS